jgi:hypothetical protein
VFGELNSMEKATQLLLIERIWKSKKFGKPWYYFMNQWLNLLNRIGILKDQIFANIFWIPSLC